MAEISMCETGEEILETVLPEMNINEIFTDANAEQTIKMAEECIKRAPVVSGYLISFIFYTYNFVASTYSFISNLLYFIFGVSILDVRNTIYDIIMSLAQLGKLTTYIVIFMGLFLVWNHLRNKRRKEKYKLRKRNM